MKILLVALSKWLKKGANKGPRNYLSGFFIWSFNVLATPSINTSKFPSDFMILIRSFISSFKINKGNPTALFLLIFSFKLIAFEAKLLTNPDKLSLVKGVAIFVSAFFPKLPNQEPEDPLFNFRYLSLTKFYISWHIISKGICYFSFFSCF